MAQRRCGADRLFQYNVGCTSRAGEEEEGVRPGVASGSVPGIPSSSDSQLIYLFNGMQPDSAAHILQPVLQWGSNALFGGSYWCITNWYADGQGGPAVYGTSQPRVNPGDVLQGVMTCTGQSGTEFNYKSSFVGYPAADVTQTDVDELTWAYETLECYNLTQCSDYPNALLTAMYNIEIRTGSPGSSGTDATIDWFAVTNFTDCGQSCVIGSNDSPGGVVYLYYRTPTFDHTTQRVTALSRTPDHVDLFVIGFDDAVWSTWWDAEHGWQPWFQIHPETVFDHTTQRVTALSRTADHVDLFVIGFDNAVWSTWWDAEHGWQPWFQIHPETVFDHTTQQVTALSRTADHVDLFVIGFDNAVWSTWWDAEHGWQPWFQIL